MRHSFCIDRLLWGITVGHPSNSWASCNNSFTVPFSDEMQKKSLMKSSTSAQNCCRTMLWKLNVHLCNFPACYSMQILDYIHSPAHGCITQPPCVAPSGYSARVIAYIALCWDCHIQQQSHSVNYANQHSPFARRRTTFARRRHDVSNYIPPIVW